MRSAVLLGLAALAFGCDVSVDKSDAGPGPIPGSITGRDAGHSDQFGSAVAIAGDVVVIGSSGADVGTGTDAAPGAGLVVVYARSGISFTEAARLTRPDESPEWGDAFGTSVAIAGDLLLVGAPGIDRDPAEDIEPFRDAGAVYVFQGAGASWTHTSTLLSPAPFLDQRYGSSLALAADVLLVGASGVDRDSRDVGAVVVYTRSGSEFVLAEAATASVR